MKILSLACSWGLQSISVLSHACIWSEKRHHENKLTLKQKREAKWNEILNYTLWCHMKHRFSALWRFILFHSTKHFHLAHRNQVFLAIHCDVNRGFSQHFFISFYFAFAMKFLIQRRKFFIFLASVKKGAMPRKIAFFTFSVLHTDGEFIIFSRCVVSLVKVAE